jgi:hypothetical protein
MEDIDRGAKYYEFLSRLADCEIAHSDRWDQKIERDPQLGE